MNCCYLFLLAVVAVFFGCAHQPVAIQNFKRAPIPTNFQSATASPQVVKIMPDQSVFPLRASWSIVVKGGMRRDIRSFKELTNGIVDLHLQYGDVVVYGTPRLVQAESWLLLYLETQNVSVYFYRGRDDNEFLSIPAYHWVAPFNEPGNLDKSSFFYEGRILGTGLDGYRRLLSHIDQNPRPQILLTGSAYEHNSGFGPNMRPYERVENLLDEITRKNKIEIVDLMESP